MSKARTAPLGSSVSVIMCGEESASVLIVSVALYKPFGVAGLVIGTAAANVVMTYLQLQRLHVGFNRRLELGHTLMITIRILVAAVLCGATCPP